MRSFHFSRKQLCIPYSVFLLLFIILPMLLIVLYAFTGEDTAGNLYFSLNNFLEFFTSASKLQTLGVSVTISFITTFFCLVIAYPVAYILARSGWKQTYVLLMLFIMPMWLNFVLRITALRELLNIIGFLGKYDYINTVIGMVYDFLPFMILPLYTSLQKLDKSLLEAATDLGAGPVHTFIHVTLPLSMPGILSGITMVFMPSMTNYVVSETLGNSNITILGK
ncbi:MAG: ABC transporter permease, partial [Clostridia bacterium]|nr:ABC transporter permease [Clostridia bacterium]